MSRAEGRPSTKTRLSAIIYLIRTRGLQGTDHELHGAGESLNRPLQDEQPRVAARTKARDDAGECVHRDACQAYCPSAETSDEAFGLQDESEKWS
jgi:hypothetical protein